jgi:exonuclease III
VPGSKKNGMGRGSGGVGVFVSVFLAQYVERVVCDGKDMVWIRVEVEGKKKRVFGLVYGPDSSKVKSVRKEFFDSLKVYVSKFKSDGFEVVVLGDFNARVGKGDGGDVGKWGEECVNDNGKMLLSVVREGGRVQVIEWKEGRRDRVDVYWGRSRREEERCGLCDGG